MTNTITDRGTTPGARRRFWIGVLIGAAAALLLAGLVAVSGVVPMAATGRPDPVDRLGKRMWESSMVWRASDDPNPFADDAEAIARGFEHYRAMCVHCHGAPNVPRAEWARGMHPLPPMLTAPWVQQRTDGKLFYIVRHGVRATGMPAIGRDHSDDDVWHIVAFLRHLGAITEEQERRLKKAAPRHDHGDHQAHEDHHHD